MEDKHGGESKAVKTLIDQLATPDCSIAYERLVEMGSRAVPVLCLALPYNVYPVRLQIIRILGESLDKEALPVLWHTRRTASWELQIEAARAIYKICLHHFIIGACWNCDPEDDLLAE